ncbi:hypothetical protein F1D05_19455 [Kribbella qitaiheensis]|uniref:Uncharacterized protein n=1 Tax=Kribbella qitaiheensis TaxID=1544730 RepID=A0A7G6X0D5_9ACTN|nr:hypothetical protein [Kribbella qitaiheensis]QNE19700.1 hypothetical protein F1D05_19455 [Kribbella qitaiheensis]
MNDFEFAHHGDTSRLSRKVRSPHIGARPEARVHSVIDWRGGSVPAMTLMAWFSACWGRSVDWGSVAEWVGGLGTTGALLLGLRILARDQNNAERAQMDQIGWWYGTHKVRWGWIVANNSTLPVHVWFEPSTTETPLFFNGPVSTGALARTGQVVGPGETFVFYVADAQGRRDASQKMAKRSVVIDNAGRQWEHQFGKGWILLPKRRSITIELDTEVGG